MKLLTICRSIAALLLAGAWTTLEMRSAELFSEPWRPQFHFTPQVNWMNDPNGMVFYDGEYHLFPRGLRREWRNCQK